MDKYGIRGWEEKVFLSFLRLLGYDEGINGCFFEGLLIVFVKIRIILLLVYFRYS